MISYYVHRAGKTTRVDSVDAALVQDGAAGMIWADIEQPTESDGKILNEVFGIHPLAVQDALSNVQHPKVETYGPILYVVLHGINFHADRDFFETHDTDFFLSNNFLITVHDGKRRSIAHICKLCQENDIILKDGPVGLMHRIVDTMVDHYRPEVDEVEVELDKIEEQVLTESSAALTRDILTIKRDIAAMRRIVLPQRDVVGRLARREFGQIDQEMAYRFRDVYDQLVRLADDAIIFQERVTGILEAHLASISNRLALSSQHLAAVATIFGTLTVITGIWGMNVKLPGFTPGERDDFWWIVAVMVASVVGFYWFFRRKDWL